MKIIDLHCDTFYRMKEASTVQKLPKNQFHIDLEKLRKGKSFLQCFALYSDLGACKKRGQSQWNYVMELYDLGKKAVEENKETIEMVISIEQADRAKENGRLAGLWTVEDLGIIENDSQRLEKLYDMGVRLATLTWNYENSIGYPNDLANRERGLKPFGREIVYLMNEKGMVVDVSHLSDGGFWDCIEVSEKPIVASHSNARAVQGHQRNLTDDMIRALAEKGGITGLNFCPVFVSPDKENMKIEGLVRHVRHIVDKGGIEVMALGTDFDGIGGKLEVAHFGQMGKLVDKLEQEGFSTEEIEKICWKNAQRVFEDIIG